MQDDGVAQSATAPSLEFLKNGDAAARLDIARVVDALSGRVSLLDLRMRLGGRGLPLCARRRRLRRFASVASSGLVKDRIHYWIFFIRPTRAPMLQPSLLCRRRPSTRVDMPLEETMRMIRGKSPPDRP